MTAKQIAAIGWMSLFTLTWMFLLGLVDAEAAQWGAWVFFLVVAVFGESASARKPKDEKAGKQ